MPRAASHVAERYVTFRLRKKNRMGYLKQRSKLNHFILAENLLTADNATEMESV